MILLSQHVGINDWLFLWRIFLEIPQNIVTNGTFYALSRLGIMRSPFTECFFGYEFTYILSLSSLNVDVINIIHFLYCFLCNYHKTIFNVTKNRKLWCPRMALIMCCVCVCVHIDFEQAEVIRDTESLRDIEPAWSSLPETRKNMSDLGLWKMQICAIARLRFLKLKHGKKELLTLWVSEHRSFVSEFQERVESEENLKLEHGTQHSCQKMDKYNISFYWQQ